MKVILEENLPKHSKQKAWDIKNNCPINENTAKKDLVNYVECATAYEIFQLLQFYDNSYIYASEKNMVLEILN